MCESKCEGGRRCPHTPDKIIRANRNRRLSREKRNNVVRVLKDHGLDGAARAVKHSRPSDLAALAVHMEARNPEVAAAITSAVNGAFPGTHNMVMQDRRDQTSLTDRDNEGALRANPHRLSAVQAAAAAVDRDLLDKDMVPASQRAELAQSVRVREKAVSVGLLDGETMTLDKELTPEQELFLASTSAQDMARLTALDDSVADKVFDHAFRHAKVEAAPRELFATPNTSIKEALDGGGEVLIGEGVTARYLPPSDTFDGGYVLEVDGSPNRAGVTLPVSPNDEVEDVMSRIPKITSITDDHKENAPMGQSSLYERALNPDSPTGQTTLRALERSLIDAAYNADRSGGVTRRRSARDPQKLIDRVREGKSPHLNAHTLVGTGHRTGEPSVARHEGYLTGGLIRRQSAARDEMVGRLAKAKGVDLGSNRTVAGNERPKLSRTYRGDLDKDARKASEQAGFKPRSDNPKTGTDPRVSGALGTITDVPKVPAEMDEQNLIGRHGPHGKLWTNDEVDQMVRRANRAARHGANPETTDVSVAVAAADLARDAKAARDGALLQGVRPKAVTGQAMQTLPAGVSLDELFPVGGPVETKGYQVIGGTDSTREPIVRGRDKKVKVVYTTSAAVSYAGTSTAVVPDGTTMRVAKVDDSGSVPTVYLIEQDTLIDGQKD